MGMLRGSIESVSGFASKGDALVSESIDARVREVADEEAREGADALGEDVGTDCG